MNRFLTAAAIGLAQWWTRAYTVGTPGDLAYARRAEIEADIWEFERDVRRTDQGAATAWARLLLGVPDDLSWRLAQGVSTRAVMWTGPVVVGVLLSIFWLVSSTQELDVALPPPPPRSRKRVHAAYRHRHRRPVDVNGSRAVGPADAAERGSKSHLAMRRRPSEERISAPSR